MLSRYRSVLSRPGAIGFSAAGLVGRLPLSMAGLGILLLVQGDTGSYGVGGSVSAVYMVANAVIALPFGRLVDARGQGRVLTVAALVFGSAMVVLVITVQADLPMAAAWVSGVALVSVLPGVRPPRPRPAPSAAAPRAGGSLPPVDACVRTRW